MPKWSRKGAKEVPMVANGCQLGANGCPMGAKEYYKAKLCDFRRWPNGGQKDTLVSFGLPE